MLFIDAEYLPPTRTRTPFSGKSTGCAEMLIKVNNKGDSGQGIAVAIALPV